MQRYNSNNPRPLTPQVTVRAEECNYNSDKMVRKFSKTIKKEGIIEECRERAFFKKPSVKRTEKKRARQRVIDKVNRTRSELFNTKDRFIKRKK